MKNVQAREASCRCGQVVLQMEGDPILTSACYCSDCKSAGRVLQVLPEAPPVLDADGGTHFVLYRKDRVRCVRGDTLLKAYRLKLESPTRRVIATCCHSAIYLEFTNGHWLSVYKGRIPESHRPPLQMRVMTGKKSDTTRDGDGTPTYAGHSGRFFWKLIAAWAAMKFRNPELPWQIEE